MKLKTIIGFVAGIAGIAALLWPNACPADEHDTATLPFYASLAVKPNVLFILDTSMSMKCCATSSCDSGYNWCGTKSNSRIQVAQRVLTGTGKQPIKYQTYNVWMGNTTGNESVWNDLYNAKAFVEIILVQEVGVNTNQYEIISKDYYLQNYKTKQFYFVMKTLDDAYLGGSEIRDNVSNATYALDRLLVDYNVDQAYPIHDNIPIDGQALGPRRLFQPDTKGTSFESLFKTYYGKMNDNMVMRVRKVNNCYSWTPCYVPAPAPTDGSTDPYMTVNTFIFANQNDFDNAIPVTHDDIVNSMAPLQDFMAYYNSVNSTTFGSYVAVESRQVCGDGWNSIDGDPTRSTRCPQDGYYSSRDVKKFCADVTANSTKVRVTNWTATDIAANIMNLIPKVGEVDAWTKNDNYVGPEFIKESAATREDWAVRKGLDWGLVDTNQKYRPWEYPALTASCLQTPDFCHFFDDQNGKFTGLPYKQLAAEQQGIMDRYKDVRYGFMVYDSPDGNNGSNNDFSRVGANLIYNLSEGGTNNLYLQEIISQADLNGDGKIAKTCTPNTSCVATTPDGDTVQTYISDLQNPSDYTPLASSLRDAFTYIYDRYFTTVDNANENNTTSTGPTNTSPTMFNHWNVSKYGMNDFNGHVVLNDPYFYYGCRKNSVILVTDGGQTTGIPLNKLQVLDSSDRNLQSDLAQVITTQTKYVDAFVHPNNWQTTKKNASGSWAPTKVYLIGFGLGTTPKGADTYAVDMLEAMAAASDLPDDYVKGDLTEPLYANDEQGLVTKLNFVMNKIMEGTYARSAPAINSTFTGASAGYFDVVATDYLWEGHLVFADVSKAFAMQSGSTTVSVSIDAATWLNSRNADTRKILTADRNPWVRVDFTKANASRLFPYLVEGNMFDQNGDGTLNSTDAEILIDFIRGKAGATFVDQDKTVRTWKLGAIYHSTPASIGTPPSEALQGDTAYHEYVAEKARTPEIVYVGALDGMLHGFYFSKYLMNGSTIVDTLVEDGHTLDEAFAYIPHYILPRLYTMRLTEQDIYVDGDPDIGVMRVNWDVDKQGPYPDASSAHKYCSTEGKWCWQTILFGGLRDGGTTYYSLNISNIGNTLATAADGVKVRWEYGDGDTLGQVDPFLGNTWSLPFVEEVLWQPEDADTMDTKLILAFGGGKTRDSKSYEGSWLYILDADAGTKISRLLVPSVNQKCDLKPGDLLTEENYGNSCDVAHQANYNQVPGDALLLDVNYDEFPDFIYFGDIEGRVWKAVIHDPDPAKWGLCLFFDTGDTGYDDLSDPSSECDGDLREYVSASNQPDCVNAGKRRPVFYRAVATPAPEGAGNLIYFGTGHIEDADQALDETHRNYVFAIWDTDEIDKCSYGKIWPGKYKAGESGWPIQLDVGEKLMSAPLIVASDTVGQRLEYKGEIIFSTFNNMVTVNPCKPGASYNYRVDFDTGAGGLVVKGALERREMKEGLASKTLLINGRSITFENGNFNVTTPPSKTTEAFYYWWVQ